MSTTKMTSTPAGVQTDVQATPEHVTQKIPNRRGLKKSARTVQKSASAFRTISEVADDLKVEQHVLRFWETKFNQIKPLKRGGGRRYYRPEDVDLLKGIHHLLYHDGYTIKGVQKLLSSTRGNLSARLNAQPSAMIAEPDVAAVETPVVEQKPQKSKAELKAMLDELKSMRNLIS